MVRPHRLIVLFAAAILLPTTSATWYGFGSHEPDNGLDSTSWIWFNKPGLAKDRVYFNAYTTVDGTMNPNVGVLKSDIEPMGFEGHHAMLGLWIDCNGDGYVGMAETALREYKGDLLLDRSICPATTGSPNSWNGQPHYNNWVTELIPIAGRSARPTGDARLIRDAEAMVWGDYGTPDYKFARGTCPLQPLPRGTTRHVGGFLDYADCRVSQIVGDENDLASNYNLLVNTAGNPGGLALANDERWNQPGHPLNSPTFGSSSSEHAIVHVQDCDEDYIYNWGNLPDALNDFDNRGIRPVDTTHVNHQGTLPGTVNYTMESIPLPASPGNSNSADCDPTNDRSDEFYTGYDTIEGDHPAIPTNPKTKATWNFDFTVTTRGGAPLGLLQSGSGGASSDGGIEPYEAVCVICDSSEWSSDSFLFKPTPQVIRGNVDQGFSLAAGYYITYYAYVGSIVTQTKLLKLPGSGSTEAYGFATCGADRSSVKNGWDCNPAHWNFNLDGTPMTETQPLARIGMPYNLRDVDCYDNTLAKSGPTDIAIGPAAYGDDPCAIEPAS